MGITGASSKLAPPGALIDQVDLRKFLVMDASSDTPSEYIDGYTSKKGFTSKCTGEIDLNTKIFYFILPFN